MESMTPTPNPLPINASQEAGGNLDQGTAILRQLYALELDRLQLELSRPTNAFVPIEVPTFLGGA